MLTAPRDGNSGLEVEVPKVKQVKQTVEDLPVVTIGKDRRGSI